MELEPVIQRFELDDTGYKAGMQRVKRELSEYERVAQAQAQRLSQMHKEIQDREFNAALNHNRRMNLAKGLSRFNEWTTLVQPVSPEYAAAARRLGRYHEMPAPVARAIPTAIPYLDDMGAVPVLSPVSAQRARQIERGEAARRRLEKLGASGAMYGTGDPRVPGRQFGRGSSFGPGFDTSNIIGRGGGWGPSPYGFIGPHGTSSFWNRHVGGGLVSAMSTAAPPAASGVLGGLIGAAGGPIRGLVGGAVSGAMLGGPMGAVAGGAAGFGIGALSSGLKMTVDLFEQAVHGAMKLGEAVFRIGVEYEKVLIYFRVFTKSQEDATGLVLKLRDLAVSSPFRFDQLSKTANTLLGYGISPSHVVPTTARLSMMAGGSEERLHRLSLAYAQVLSAGRFHGQELRQFAEAGVGAPDFASTMGIGTMEFRARMRQGMIGPDVVTQTINRLTGGGGRFASINDALLNSVSGRMNALTETLQFKAADVGIKVFDRFKVSDKIKEATEWLDKMLGRVNELEPAFKFIDDAASSTFRNMKAGYEAVMDMWEGSSAQKMWKFLMPTTWDEAAKAVDAWGKSLILMFATVMDEMDAVAGKMALVTYMPRKAGQFGSNQLSKLGIEMPGREGANVANSLLDDSMSRLFGGGSLSNKDFAMMRIRDDIVEKYQQREKAGKLAGMTAALAGVGGPGVFGMGASVMHQQNLAGIHPLTLVGAGGFLPGLASVFANLPIRGGRGDVAREAAMNIFKQGKPIGGGMSEIPVTIQLDAEVVRLAQTIKDGFREGVSELDKFRRQNMLIDQAQFGKYMGAQPLMGGVMASMFRGLGELNEDQAGFARYEAYLKLKGRFGSGVTEMQLPTLALAGSAEAARVMAESSLPTNTLVRIEDIMKEAVAEEKRQADEMADLNKWMRENPIVIKPRGLNN